MKFERENDLDFLRGAAQALQDENARLRAEAAARQAELALAQAAKERALAAQEQAQAAQEQALAAQERAQAERDEARAEVERLSRELAVLQEQLARRIKALYGRKSERRKLVDAAASSPGEAEAEPAPERKPRRGHGPTPQPTIPVEEVINELTEEARGCEHCGGTLEPLGAEAEISELIAIEERRIVLERHLRAKYQCPGCHTGVKTAPGPVKVVPGGRYALNFAVEVAYMKYLGHLPLERQVQLFRHDGLQVTTSTLFDQVDALATTLTPTYQAIWNEIQAEPVLRADETPWNVLSNGHTRNERYYAWVAVSERHVAYRLLDTRSKNGAAAILGAFAGTLMVDGLTSYPAAARTEPGAAPRFRVANCMAHARRKFVDCEAHAPVETKEALDMFGELYAIEREGKQPGADLAALREHRSRPIVDRLFAWARAQQARTDLLPASGLAKALAYLLNHEPGLRVFLDDPAVPIDNNESERALRGPVLGRKNSYGSRSRRGTETAAILYTLVESAKRIGVPPKLYLEAAAEHALRKAGAILLPEEFKRQLEEAGAIPTPG